MKSLWVEAPVRWAVLCFAPSLWLIVLPLDLGAALPPLDPADTAALAAAQTNIVRQFRFMGNRAFSAAELGRVVQTYTNRPLASLELETARVALTLWYVNHGYVNSGAVIDDPTVREGVFTFKIVEGRLTDIRIRGNRWIWPGFYARRLRANGGDPLNANEVRNTLQIWREDYPVEQVNGEIQPGALPGDAVMNVNLKEKFPYHFGLQYANDKPPSTGPEQVTALLRADSLTGNADLLTFDYGIVRSADDAMAGPRWLGWDDLSASYSIPFTARDTALGVQYSRSSASVLEAEFAQLDIRSEMESYGVSLSQPLFRTPTRELSLTLTGERRSSQTYLLGIPYSFEPGAVDGKAVDSALRLSSQFVDRDTKHVFAARATLNLGLDVLDATRNTSGPDGRFVSVIGQVQYLRRFWNTRNELLLKVAGQYTEDPLLFVEQLAIGGASTVRGYRENTMIRDKGVMATSEFHIPLWHDSAQTPIIQLVSFVDWGLGKDNDNVTTQFDDIGSMGVGIIVTPCKNVTGSLYYGYPFRHIVYAQSDLQDIGIHFRLTVWAF
jgi:hemolysin activation/secretion protein